MFLFRLRRRRRWCHSNRSWYNSAPDMLEWHVEVLEGPGDSEISAVVKRCFFSSTISQNSVNRTDTWNVVSITYTYQQTSPIESAEL